MNTSIIYKFLTDNISLADNYTTTDLFILESMARPMLWKIYELISLTFGLDYLSEINYQSKLFGYRHNYNIPKPNPSRLTPDLDKQLCDDLLTLSSYHPTFNNNISLHGIIKNDCGCNVYIFNVDGTLIANGKEIYYDQQQQKYHYTYHNKFPIYYGDFYLFHYTLIDMLLIKQCGYSSKGMKLNFGRLKYNDGCTNLYRFNTESDAIKSKKIFDSDPKLFAKLFKPNQVTNLL